MRISDWSSDVCSSDLQTAVAIVGPPKLLFGREPLMEAARHIGIHEERSLRHMLDQDLLAIARTLDRTDLADQDHDPVGLRSGNGQLRVLTARDRVLVLKTECLGQDRKSTRLNPVTHAHL